MSEKETGLQKLLNLNVNEFTEKKGKFTYLSWSLAWKEFIKIYPEATYEIIKNENGIPCFGSPEIGYMAYTNVTANNITHSMWLPVLDFSNKTKLKPNMFDINTTVMRCLVKNLAMFGLGLYIYAGEDLPEEEKPKELPKEIKDMISSISDIDELTKYFKKTETKENKTQLTALCGKRRKEIEGK